MWLTFAILLVAVLTLLSAVVDSQLGATFLGFGVLVALTIASLWGPAADLSPAGLVNAPNAVISGASGLLLWPVVTSAAAALLFVAGGMWAFSRKEL